MIRFITFLLFAALTAVAQPTSSEIKLRLKKLNVLGTVLYVAAHPDDENTRAITYFSNEKLYTTGYLSLTRGDGGQNLIGSEIRDLLGVIRTQELLAARSVDGGYQFFTRANDFGFSKTADETLRIWDKNAVLSDVVRVIRQFQPDIILTRFPPDARAGHGHHTSSAMLAQEAFDISNDPKTFPEQLKTFNPWQAKRILTNTGRWWNQTINENTPGIVAIDMGGYNPLLGESYSELAAESRTMHKSQGFGSQGRRGEAFEFFEPDKGEKTKKELFEGINTTWLRVKGGEKILPLVETAIADFNEEKPWSILPQLIAIRKAIGQLENGIWKERKTKEVDNIIQDCLGLYVDATADYYFASPGSQVNASLEIINRSPIDIEFTGVSSKQLSMDSSFRTKLPYNKVISVKTQKNVSGDVGYSGPYWLKKSHSEGLFTVEDERLIGSPQAPAPISFDFAFNILGETITISDAVDFKTTDPVKGELSRPVEVTPPVFVSLSKPVFVFANSSTKEVEVSIKSTVNSVVKGNLHLTAPAGWKVDPISSPFELMKRGDEYKALFKVSPQAIEQEGFLEAVAVVNGENYNRSITEINYDHIPVQTLMPTAISKVIRINLQKEGTVVAYIKGAGDDVPDALRNMGYEVWEMKDDEITSANLKRVDAVVLGIRLFNTSKRVKFYMPLLLDYVKNGGTLISQYNTYSRFNGGNFGLEIEQFAPYELTLSGDRVTEENSEVRILKPDHPLLNYPNAITPKDFQGWVQERGLYYPGKWDPKFEALLSMNDTNEKPKDGGLLVANYGSGQYIYTGLSFFRELPEGVSGAYKLFANLVSAGKAKKPQPQKIKPTR
jgi:LmbE family N-acetylglucosaminyl deacetylase